MKKNNFISTHFSNLIAENEYLNKFFNLLLYGIFRLFRRITKKNKPGKIVIVSLHKIGDTIFTFPALRAIDQHYPGRQKTIVCFQSGKEIYDSFFPQFRTVALTHDMFRFGERIAGTKARKILKSLEPEIIIDFTACMTSFTLIFDSGAALIYGSNKEIFKGIYDFYKPVRKQPALYNIYIDAILLVIPEAQNFKRYTPSPSYSPFGKILIHPYAGWNAKEWGINKFINLAGRLRKIYSVEFIMEENSVTPEINRELKEMDIKLILTASLKELIDNIKECSVVISNDTGCIYLGEALGKATYTIYGPTNPSFTMPEGSHHAMIQKRLLCSPDKEKICFTNGGRNGCPSNQCMQLLTLNQVFDHLTEHLNRIKIKH